MQNSIIIHVDGTPKPQPRPRATRAGLRARVYNPPSADVWKGSIRDSLRIRHKEILGKKFPGPIGLRVEFYFKAPTGFKDTFFAKHTAKPDIDNLLKPVMDVLTEEGIWADDSQVVEVSASKWIARPRPGSTGGATIRIEFFEQEGCE